MVNKILFFFNSLKLLAQFNFVIDERLDIVCKQMLRAFFSNATARLTFEFALSRGDVFIKVYYYLFSRYGDTYWAVVFKPESKLVKFLNTADMMKGKRRTFLIV